MVTLSKYWAMIRYMIVRSLEFRSEMIIYVVLDFIPFAVLFLIWQSVYQGQDSINGLTLAQTIQYYLFVIVIEGLTGVHFEGWRTTEVREGKIDFFLTRPLPYFFEVFLKEVGGKLIYALFFLPISLLLWLGTSSLFQLTLTIGTQVPWLLFLMFLASGFVINFMVAWWVVLLAFWLEGAQGLEHFKWILIALFSGTLIPPAFMPSWLQTLTWALPLKYLYVVPIQLAQGLYQVSWYDGAYLLGTLAVMGSFSWWLWNRAKYQYASAGG